MNIVIREMTKNDTERVKQIAKVTWKDAFSHIMPIEVQEKTLREAYDEQTMEKRFTSSSLFVAEEKGEIVGYAFFSQKNKEGKVLLESIYIHPDYQQKGIGTKLIHTGIETLQPKRLCLNVLEGNKKAIAYYKAQGFQEEGVFHHHFAHHPVIFMKMFKKL